MSPGSARRPRPASARLAPPRRAARALGATLGATLLVGCGEPPSFQMSWEFAGRDPAADSDADEPSEAQWQPTRLSQCTRIGVGGVRVRAVPKGALPCDLDAVVAAAEYDCLPAGGLPVEGLVLEPGEYTLVVHGLRRTGEPWACPADELEVELDADGDTVFDELGDPLTICPAPDEPCTARATVDIVVDERGRVAASEGEELATISVVLAAPPECDDGIDNDVDGDVDIKDPACLADPEGREYAESSVTYFDHTLGFLASSAIRPVHVEVGYVRLELDGEPLVTVPRTELVENPSSLGVPLQSAILEAGVYELRATALGPDLQPRTEAIVRTLEMSEEGTLTVLEDQANYARGHFHFDAADFLEPLLYPFGMSLAMELGPGQLGESCELGGQLDEDDDGKPDAPITIDELWVRVVDENGQVLDAPELGLAGTAALGGSLMPIDANDGQGNAGVSFACPSSFVISDPLAWGNYEAVIEARIGGQTCFRLGEVGAERVPLVPQPTTSAQAIYLERVSSSGACAECTEDGARICSEGVCMDGVCVPKEPELP